MSYKLVAIPPFEKELKHLAAKYPSLRSDYKELLDSLKANPLQGVPLGKDCFKIRMGIKSKGKGKSGGARVIICVKIFRQTIYLLSIYDKSEKITLTSKELSELISQIK